MKATFIFSFVFGFCGILFSQTAPQYISLNSVSNKKVLKSPVPQFMPYLALKFRTGTSKTEQTGGNKEDNVKATAWAVLDGVDSTIFQEITNEFYKQLTGKLASVGLAYTDLSKIKSSKSYLKYAAEQEERHYNHTIYGTADVFTPDNVPFFKYPALQTKIWKWQKEMEAMLSSLRLTVNFVEFDINMNQSTTFTPEWKITTTTADAKAAAIIKIECVFQEATWEAATTGGYYNTPGLIISKDEYVALLDNKTIYEPLKATITIYDDKMPVFASRKFRAFKGDMKLGTFVVSVDPQEYKTAVLKALDRYGDYVVEFIKSYNTEKKK